MQGDGTQGNDLIEQSEEARKRAEEDDVFNEIWAQFKEVRRREEAFVAWSHCKLERGVGGGPQRC